MITVNTQFTLMTAHPSILAPKPASKLALPVTLYLICVAVPVRFMLGPLQMTSLRLFVIAMLPLLLVRLLKTPRIAPDILLLLFVGWTYVAMRMNTPAQAVEHAGITLLELFGGYALARIYIQTQAQFTALIKAVAGIVLLCLPLAVYETVTGDPPLIQLIRAIPLITSVEVVSIATRLDLERVQAVFAHPIHFGLFCSTAVSLVYVGLTRSLSHPRRAVTAALIIATAFLALSSGAFLAVLIQLFLIAWAALFAGTKYKWVLLVAAAAAAYVFIDLLSNRTPIRVFFSYATFSAHNAYWRGIIFEWGMVNVWANPIFGLGLKDWVRPHFMHSGSMDNFWLVNAVRYGLPGVAFIAGAWVLGLIRVARGPSTELKTAWMFCMVGLTFTLCTVHVWTAVYSFVFFMFGAGQFLAKAPDKAPAAGPVAAPRPLAFTRPFQPGFARTSP